MRVAVVRLVAGRLQSLDRRRVFAPLDDRVGSLLEAQQPRDVLDEVVADRQHQLRRARGRLAFHRADDERARIHDGAK